MSRHEFQLKARVCKYPGMSGWFFAMLPKIAAAEIKQGFGQKRRGWGAIPVKATVGQSVWSSSIFPDSKSGTYLLPIKLSIRKREGIKDGDVLSLTLRIDVQRLVNGVSSQ